MDPDVQLAIAEKNRLWFDYARPSNWAFLAGDRTEQAFSRDYRDRNIRAFAQEMQQFLPLIADAESKAIQAFGVEGPMFGFARRSAFLFHNGKLVWRDAKASTKDQAEIVLKALDTLSPSKK